MIEKNGFAALPDPVRWSEGMLLSPQHMQQADIYWEQQLAHRNQLLQPYGWGLLSLDYDGAALITGRLVVTSVHAVMPDGLVVRWDEKLECDLKSGWKDGAPLRIWLRVPVRADGGSCSNTSIQRYRPIGGDVKVDENTGDNPVPVGRQRPLLSLFAGDLVPANYVAFPLCEIERDPSDGFQLGAYHPPMLRMSAAAFLGAHDLGDRLMKLAATVRDRIRDLAYARGADDDLKLLDAESRRQLTICGHLAAALPPFELRLRSGVAHPFDLYLSLAGLVGHLASVGTRPSPPLLPTYDHDDFRAGFEEALRYAEEQLALVVAQFEVLRFQQQSDGRFTLKLPERMPADRLLVELRPRQGQTEQALRDWMNRARIVSDDLLAEHARRRLLGAHRKPIHPRGGMRLGEGAVLFEVTPPVAEVNGDLIPVFRPGCILVVDGPTDVEAPRELRLHRPREKAPGGEHAGV